MPLPPVLYSLFFPLDPKGILKCRIFFKIFIRLGLFLFCKARIQLELSSPYTKYSGIKFLTVYILIVV